MQKINIGKIQKYFAVFRFSFIHALRNYKTLIGLGIFLITCLIIFYHLWKVTAASMGADHLEPNRLLWYIAFNEWVLIALPDVQDDMEEDLQSGKLAYLLPRPISYLWSSFMEAAGVLCARLIVLGLVAFSFAWIRTDEIPFSSGAFIMTLAIGTLAGCIAIIFKMFIGLSSFWVKQVEPFHWIWEKLLFSLGGLMLPLSVYPMWLQKIAYLTPFPLILGGRSALALDYTWSLAFSLFGSLFLWGILGASCLLFLYRTGLRIVHIEGG